jgi:hypothetical protein
MSKKTDIDNVVAFPTPENEVSVSPNVETTPSRTVSDQLMAIVVEDHGLYAPRKPAIIEAEDYAAYSKQLDAPVGDDVIRAENAKMIRLLGSRAIGDLIEIGRILVDTRDNRCKHGEWLAWLEQEFNWSRQTADNYIHMYESFGQIANRVSNLAIDCRSLYLLAAPSTPETARDEVIERSEAGEFMTPAQIKEIVDKTVNAEIEAKVKALRAEAFQREAELRSEYEGAGQAKIDKAVNKATVPLQKQIQKYEVRLAKIKERDEARAARAKSGVDPQPKIGNSTDPAESAAAMAAAHAANEGEGAADTKPAKKSKSKSAPKSKPAATSHEITAHSACDSEAPKMSGETEEMPMPDFDRLAKFKRRTVDPEAVWICEQLELAWSALHDRGRPFRPRT